jgi:glutamyl-tRNA reductase
MAVVAVGLSYKSAPLELLERSAIPEEHSAEAVRALLERPPIAEAVVLATCNRVEAYAAGEDADAAVDAIRSVFVERCRVDARALDEGFYTLVGDAAVSHLFRVAAGLDSMIVGETEILGQVRRGFRVGAAGAELSPLFQQALRVGKRVRTETDLPREGGSFVSAAAAIARRAGRRIVVVGAGRVGAGVARELADRDVVVVSRSPAPDRVPLEALETELARADAAVFCTSSPELLADYAMIERARPSLVVDIAVPRDVDPLAAQIPGVRLVGLEEVAAAAGDEGGSTATAQAIVEEELVMRSDRLERRAQLRR